MEQLKTNRVGEWPITRFWYTQKKGQTIEEVIDTDTDFFLWVVKTFQNVTPKQAEYFENKTGKKLNPIVIQDVTPYEWQKGDPEALYMKLCETQDLEWCLKEYRGVSSSLF